MFHGPVHELQANFGRAECASSFCNAATSDRQSLRQRWRTLRGLGTCGTGARLSVEAGPGATSCGAPLCRPLRLAVGEDPQRPGDRRIKACARLCHAPNRTEAKPGATASALITGATSLGQIVEADFSSPKGRRRRCNSMRPGLGLAPPMQSERRRAFAATSHRLDHPQVNSTTAPLPEVEMTATSMGHLRWVGEDPGNDHHRSQQPCCFLRHA